MGQGAGHAEEEEEEAEEEGAQVFLSILLCPRSSHLEIWTFLSTSPSSQEVFSCVQVCSLLRDTWLDSGNMCMRRFWRLWVYFLFFLVKADFTPEVDSPVNLDIVLRVPLLQLADRSLSCLRSIGCIPLGDDHEDILRIQRSWLASGYTLTRQATELFLNFIHSTQRWTLSLNVRKEA